MSDQQYTLVEVYVEGAHTPIVSMSLVAPVLPTVGTELKLWDHVPGISLKYLGLFEVKRVLVEYTMSTVFAGRRQSIGIIVTRLEDGDATTNS